MYSWDSDAHKLVAKMAAGLLSRKAARFVTFHTKNRDDKQFNRRMTVIQHALVSISSWADYIAATDPTMQWSAPLHFAHTPHQACDAFNLARDCPGGRCIVTAISEFMEIASNFEAAKDARLEAIKFLVHLVADIHNPMHLGFEDDAGGNRIHVFVGGTDEPPMSLHEVWDTVLVDMIKDQSEWWETKLRLSLSERQSYPDISVKYFAAEIASETAQQVTCQFGYQFDDGRWIQPGDVLPIEYLERRAETAKIQLKKSAVRLAQLIEHISARYYEQERLSRQTVTIADGSSFVVANPFESLEGDDASFEDFVFELDDPMDVVNETDEEEIATEDIRLVTESIIKDVETAVPKKRSKNQKKADAKKRSKPVLIKRDSMYYITQRKYVTSDRWVPRNSYSINVPVPGGYIEIFFDNSLPDIASLDRAQASRLLAQALGRDCPPAPDSFVPPLLASEVDISISRQGLKGGIKFGSVSSLDRSSIFPIPSEKELTVHYPQDDDAVPRSQRYAMDVFSANGDKLVVWNLPRLVVISRRDFLEKDAEGYRKPGDMVRLHFNYSQVKIAPSHLYAFFVDTRVYDGPLSADIILRLDEISKRMKTQKNVVRISASSLSCLIPAITGVNAFLKQRIPAGEVRAEYCPQLTEVNSITRTGREFIAGSTTIQLVFTK